MTELPVPERLQHDEIVQQRRWVDRRRLAITSYVKSPLVLDGLYNAGILNDRLYRAGEKLRGVWYGIGHAEQQISFGYEDKVPSEPEMSDRQADFYRLYSDCCWAILSHYRQAVINLCCDNVKTAHTSLILSGLRDLDKYLAKLYKNKDRRLMLYLDYLQKGA